jgi:hypothetical protein
MFGIPSDLKTDNGPTFTSIEFENMCKFFGIRHRLITPYWPRANGEAERFIRNLNKVMRNSAVNNTPWRRELNMFLGAYRATPHSSTGVAPANLIFKFNNISRLSSLVKFRKFDTSLDDTKAVQKDVLAKAKMKENGDKKLRVVEANFKVGDLVLYKAPKKRITSKSTPLRELEVYCIRSIKNSMLTVYSTIIILSVETRLVLVYLRMLIQIFLVCKIIWMNHLTLMLKLGIIFSLFRIK